MSAPRQTISYLTQRFAEAGIRPLGKYGQNFLIDLNLLEFLAEAAQVTPEDLVLEVGTGTGSLTALLAQQAAAVVTVEIDRHLHQLASEQLLAFTNVTQLQVDVLKSKHHLNPHVLDVLRQQLQDRPLRLKLAANLPYQIATPLLSNLLACEFLPVSMTVTIQKELAERITAQPCRKDYGALSIWMQSQCEISILRILPPTVFWPRPKVESAIIQIVPQPEKRSRIEDLAFFHTFVRSMFFHRRKFLRSELWSAFKEHLDKPAVDEILSHQRLGPSTRAEELDPDAMLDLCRCVRARLDAAGAQLASLNSVPGKDETDEFLDPA